MDYSNDCTAEHVFKRLEEEEMEKELQKQRDMALFNSTNAQLIQIELLKKSLRELEQQNHQIKQSYLESQITIKRNKCISIISISIAALSLISTILIAILK